MTTRRCPGGLVTADHGDILQFNKNGGVDGYWETKSLLEAFGRDYVVLVDTFPTTHGTGAATSGYSTLGWMTTGTLTLTGVLDGAIGHPGICRLTSAVGASSGCFHLPTNAGVTGGPFMLDDVKAFQWIVRTNTLPAGSIVLGLGDNGNSATLGSNSLYFKTDSTIGANVFHAHARSGAASTEDDTSAYTPAAGFWMILTMVQDASGNFDWNINNGATSGQIPTADVPFGVAVTPSIFINDTDGANSFQLDVDEFTIVLQPDDDRFT